MQIYVFFAYKKEKAKRVGLASCTAKFRHSKHHIARRKDRYFELIEDPVSGGRVICKHWWSQLCNPALDSEF